MIPVFIEAALRSLLLGLAVALGLRIFRVRNVLAQKSAWSLVLVSALAMPVLLPVMAQRDLLPVGINIVLPARPMTLLEELQAHIQAKSGSAGKLASPAALIPQHNAATIEESPTAEKAAAPRASETPSAIAHRPREARPEQNALSVPKNSVSSPSQSTAYRADPARKTQFPASTRHIGISPMTAVLALYGAIAALFLLRLVVGVVTTLRLWHTATPVPANRLPHEAATLRIRASNKVASPITIGSAVLLPADYTNWQGKKLRIVLAHERSHIRQGDFYLQLLASLYGAFVWFSPLGWWLKRELAELAEAISDRAAVEEAASCTSYAQILLEFAATPRRVSLGVAMARPGSLSRRIERLLNDSYFRQCFAGGRRALVMVALVPLALIASTALVHVQAAAGAQSHSPAPVVALTSPGAPTLPAAPQLDALQTGPADADQPGDLELPPLPATPPVFPVSSNPTSRVVSEIAADVSPASAIRMNPVMMAAGGMQEGRTLSFDRTLSVSGAAQLIVSTGSGSIQIKRGSGNQIHIHGQIRVNHDGDEEKARQIAANPPIEQDGNSIRIGQHQEQGHGMSIDYQIEAPAGTQLSATSGSGNIVDEGVGQNAKLETGSGDIRATGLEGTFVVRTGSGNITAAQTGQGEGVAETGSGNIDLKDIRGSFRGQTGSGDIKASGTPAASWNLQTGSGNIELFTGNAPLTLDASTGSGSVSTEHEMVVQGSFDRHRIRGTLNGGGPTIRVQTGSGDIHIH